MTAADEKHLLHQAKMGSHAAFGRLVECHMKPAYHVAYRFVNDRHAAEEIVQDAFVRAFQSLRSFRGDAGFGTWIYRIVVNLSLNQLKAIKRGPVAVEFPDMLPVGSNGAGTRENILLTTHLNRALETLPALQRKVVLLRHFEGYSTKEVSQIIRCSEGTVKTHLFRGLRKLRRTLSFLKEETE